MVITAELIEQGRSIRGGWNLKQLRALGLSGNYFRSNGGLYSGWKWDLIGKNVPKENIDNFLTLKDKHLKIEPTKQLWPLHKSQAKLVAQMDADNLAHLQSIACEVV